MSHESIREGIKSPEAARDFLEIIEKDFEVLKRLAHEKTGLFPAVNPEIDTSESRENHMDHAWIRDSGFNLLLMSQAAKALIEAEPGNPTASRMQEFLSANTEKILTFLNQPRWLDRFRQQIVDEGAYTRLTSEAPEIHMETDGAACRWDHNQPESWAQLLIATGDIHKSGAPGYSPEAMTSVRAITDYLVRIQPRKFEGAGMWEGLPAHSPASRSNALAIAKGLEAVAPLFKNEEFFYRQIMNTVESTMAFVRQDINQDFTLPEGHPDGADLAMLATMILPGSSATELPFAKYVEENGEKLGVGALPGVKRFVGDDYHRGELGEARWFMGDPILAIGYFNESRKALRSNNYSGATKYRELGLARLNQAIGISRGYGHESDLYPELFIQRDPEKVISQRDILLRNDGEREVALQPLKRSLLWNTALVMRACGEASSVEKLFGQYESEQLLAKAA